jgi:hypothetical protein
MKTLLHYLISCKENNFVRSGDPLATHYSFEPATALLAVRNNVHTAEPLVPGSSRLQAEIAIPKLRKYKLPGNDQTPVDLIQEGENLTFCNLQTH